MKQHELQDRLIKFGVDVVALTNQLRRTRPNVHLVNQLIRSATSPALLYAEACAAESPQDFIHKMAISLKELRETKANMTMMLMSGSVMGPVVEALLDENEQLIRIFWKSIDTAKRNRLKLPNS
ncbi:MAG: four helix bundle protein [Bacteroidota bacterium]